MKVDYVRIALSRRLQDPEKTISVLGLVQNG